MKKTLLLIILFTIINTFTGFAYKIDEAKRKEVIRTIWLARNSFSHSGGTYFHPADYIRDAATNEIIGRNYYSFDEFQYCRIMLNIEGDKIVSASINRKNTKRGSKVTLVWENGLITGIEFAFVNYGKYRIIYDENNKIKGFDRGIVGGRKIKVFNEIEFEGDKIFRIITYANKNPNSKKNTIEYITNFEYKNDNEIVIKVLKYNKGKLKSGTKPSIDIYRIPGPNRAYHKGFYYETDIIYKDSTVIHKTTISKWTISKEDFFYRDGKLFKTVTLETDTDGNFEEKNIQIFFTLENQPESVPFYERKKGIYGFSKDGELIFESDGDRHRKKVDGVWTNWKFSGY